LRATALTVVIQGEDDGDGAGGAVLLNRREHRVYGEKELIRAANEKFLTAIKRAASMQCERPSPRIRFERTPIRAGEDGDGDCPSAVYFTEMFGPDMQSEP
jgi:hypothetical protein